MKWFSLPTYLVSKLHCWTLLTGRYMVGVSLQNWHDKDMYADRFLNALIWIGLISIVLLFWAGASAKC